MAAINDLISRIQDPELRAQIQAEVNKLSRQKKFGLVFEDHIPECTPLYELPVRVGTLVAKKDGSVNDLMMVTTITDGKATCICQKDTETVEYPLNQLVAVARFGEPIYPYLQPVDTVCNAPESDLWHTLIQADNYHALQLLEYLYAGQVDCIYIDPPYNTGAKDWKYNNDYVDGADSYRHSKWLSFMEKRLKLAKRLLNPKDSVLIVTIDEKEYHHLGCLLEELFPDANIQMVSSVINVKGSSRKGSFSRSCEYIYFVMMGAASPIPLALSSEWLGNIKKTTRNEVRFADMMRHGANGTRSARPNLFYPIYVSPDGKRFLGVGQPPAIHVDRSSVPIPEGVVAIWPIHSDGSEGSWGYATESLIALQKKGYLHLGKLTNKGMGISFIQPGWQKKIEAGEVRIIGYGEDGCVQLDSSDYEATYVPGNSWTIPLHNATEYGMKLLQSIIGTRFDFPKSLYAVHDAIKFYTVNKPNALIIDFFAGSGTTLHAVNLLNAEDGGHRRCIMVTNNEVSAEEAKALTTQGFRPGDEEWEKLGVARYVTWPRTVCSIEGHDVNGQPLKGNYIGSDQPMSEGFPANAAFFRLGFLDKASVRVGRQFREMLPTLWMKAGCYGPCPSVEGDTVPDMMILPQNHMAILNNSGEYALFAERLQHESGIDTVYLVTDSDADYRAMARGLTAPHKYQLYRDYLDNFRINSRR